MNSHAELMYDVIVVGGGNAAMSAALSAKAAGARVVLLEKAPSGARGGNCPYTGGGFRFTHNGPEDLRALLADPSELDGRENEVEAYTANAYRKDMLDRTRGQTDPLLLNTLVSESYQTVLWLANIGIGFELSGGRQENSSAAIGSRIGVRAIGSGPGLINMHYSAAQRLGIHIAYETKMLKVLQNSSGAVTGVRIQDKEGLQDLHAKGVILACGGFEANQEMRLKYLGGPWERAKVRGSKFNTGDGHRAALDIGAKVMGQWTGCHATPIDFDAPPTGSTDSVDRLPRRSYTYGIMLNVQGKRFVDEGENFALNNFVKMGTKILEQPEGLAFQIFDSKTKHLLELRYGSASAVTGDSMEELAVKIGLNTEAVSKTIHEFNTGVQNGNFDPSKLDRKSTKCVTPPKSNWALTIDSPPFYAFRVTGGITYTFGGLTINQKAQVLDTEDKVIPGLYATGEIVGGFFYYDSLRASGLMHGAVFGRIAGADAAGIS